MLMKSSRIRKENLADPWALFCQCSGEGDCFEGFKTVSGDEGIYYWGVGIMRTLESDSLLSLYK